MASLLTPPKSTSVTHACKYCWSYEYDLIQLTEGAESHCPFCALWLACLNLDTAVHDLIHNGDIERIVTLGGTLTIYLKRRDREGFKLEMFRLNSRSR
jgi:hypothetical protein